MHVPRLSSLSLCCNSWRSCVVEGSLVPRIHGPIESPGMRMTQRDEMFRLCCRTLEKKQRPLHKRRSEDGARGHGHTSSVSVFKKVFSRSACETVNGTVYKKVVIKVIRALNPLSLLDRPKNDEMQAGPA